MFAISAENLVNLAVVQGVLEVLFLHIVVKVVVETGIVDGVYVDMAVGSGKWFPEEGIVSLGVCGVGGVQVF